MKVSRVLLGSFLILALAACGGGGTSNPIDPTTPPDPTTTTDPTTPPDPTTTTDPTTPPDPTFPDPTTTTDPSDPTLDMSGTWTGTTTTPGVYDTEQTTLTLTQSGASLSGTLELTADDGTFDVPATGSISGTTATVSATFTLEAGGSVTYAYQGTVTSTTYSGNVTLSGLSGGTASGTFSLTKGGNPTDPTTTTDPSTPSGTVSGIVTAPTGVDVSTTSIGACLSSTSTTCEGLVETTVDSTGAYTLTGLEATSYTIIGAIDTNGNNTLDAGDYLGGVTDVTPPASGVNFSLQPYQGTQSSEVKQLIESLNEASKSYNKRAP